jgi:Dihaem cytochrome c
MPSIRGNQRLRSTPKRQNRSTFLLLAILLFWSITMGWGLSLLAQSSPVPTIVAQQSTQPQSVSPRNLAKDGAIDAVPEGLQLAESVYLENCATCHIGIPPGVLPTETWKGLLLDPNHYGIKIALLVDPFRRLTWNYLQTFSRPQAPEEAVPFLVSQSKVFKALHPGVKFSQPVNLKGCVSCHPGAEQYHYRSLSPEWKGTH